MRNVKTCGRRFRFRQQFFEYHAVSIRQAANYAQLRVGVLYTPSVLAYLDR
ncbi:hypothetical protein IV102_02325 [bacterium]|nr:hypothetical protein [bacterium]